MPTPFERLHTGVQRWLYDQRWTDLRPIQLDAIEHILGGDGDLIVAARTAGGKTEAAFLPILSAIADDHGGSIRAMYIGPLRALINDQFRRMELLCGHLGMPVHKWHGEVGQGDRKAMLKDPAGVLLITPESLEAFFVRRSGELERVFANLAFVVIDELHVFPGCERGMHLRSLLNRLDQRIGTKPRRVGLSATLGDMDRYRRWLRPSDPDRVHLINHPREGAEVKTRCYAFDAPARAKPDPDAEEESETTDSLFGAPGLLRAVFDHHRTGVNLVFANAKRVLEESVTGLRGIAALERLPEDRFLIHHGSLARDTREDAERMLQEGGDRVCCCSSTLELGVDIGSVRGVAHLDAPWSVASLAQRLGRSGRRPGEAAIFRQYHALPALDGLSLGDEEHLRPGLVRGIALFQLYLQGWCEATDVDRSHTSTLIHQIISVIAESGGIRAHQLYSRLHGSDGFKPLAPEDFADLLRHLGKKQVIEQIPDGTLLLGKNGELELADRGFYAAFASKDEYEVIHDRRRIGTIAVENAYRLGDGFRLGGRGWEIDEVDENRLRLYVRPSAKRNIPRFLGGIGIIHDRVITTMRDLLAGTEVIPYLDDIADQALADARIHFHRLKLGEELMTTGDGQVTLWPWSGSKVMETLTWALRSEGHTVDQGTLCLSIKDVETEDVLSSLRSAATDLHEAVVSAFEETPTHLLCKEKYDHFIPENSLRRSILVDRLDIEGAVSLINQWK